MKHRALIDYPIAFQYIQEDVKKAVREAEICACKERASRKRAHQDAQNAKKIFKKNLGLQDFIDQEYKLAGITINACDEIAYHFD